MGHAQYRPVMPGYFETLRIGLVSGRLLNGTDKHGSMPVALINEAAARRYWPGQSPLGQRIRFGDGPTDMADPEPREIIGVVRDVHERGLQEEPPAIVYLPVGLMAPGVSAMLVNLLPQSLLVRAPGDTALRAAAVQREIWTVDSLQPVTEVVSMEELVTRSLGSLTRLLESLLVYVSALDPVAFIAAPLVLMGVAMVSTWLPAYRASRVDPMEALRYE